FNAGLSATGSDYADNTGRVQTLFGDLTPAINRPKYGAVLNAGGTGPVHVGFHRTQLFQGRRLEMAAFTAAITFTAGQVDLHTLARLRINMVRLYPRQFVAAKRAPEPDQ